MGFLEHLQSSIILGTHLDLPHSSHFDLERINLFFHHILQEDKTALTKMIKEGFSIDTPHYKTMETALMFAVRNRLPDIAFFLIEYGANIYLETKDQESVLCLALRHELDALTDYLLFMGSFSMQSVPMQKATLEHVQKKEPADPLYLYSQLSNHRKFDDNIFVAVQKGDIATTVYLLAKGIKADITNNKKQSLLHLAIISGSLPMVLFFLNRGINIDIKDKYGNFPLLYATLFKSRIDILKLLLQRGATLDQFNHSENSALTMAIRKHNFQAIELLCKRGANINHRDGIHTPLSLVHDQIQTLKSPRKKEHFRKLLFYLFQHGAHVNAPGDTIGWTPLQLTTNYYDSKFYLDHIEKLLHLGADLDYQDAVGRTALMLAAGLGRHRSAHRLLKAGADVNILDKYGWSALMLAVYNNHFDIVRDLIRYKADVNLTSPNKQLTALKIAIEQKNEIIELYLREHGATLDTN